MNIKHLETFLWVVRLGTFSATARRLNTSQPAISVRIHELENSLGVKLFDRDSGTLQVTPKGREFIDYAERILALAFEAEQRLGDHKHVSGQVRVGVTETIALTWLPQLVARLNNEFPSLVIDLDVDLTNALWRKMQAGRLDLAMLPGPILGAALVVEYLGSALYTWMASPRLAIPRRTVTAKDLEALPIITLSSDSSLHEIIETLFRDNSSDPHWVNVCNSLNVVAALTAAGLGVSMLPPSIFHREIETGELYVLEFSPEIEPLSFWAVRPRRREQSLADMITQMARQISSFDFIEPEQKPTKHAAT